MRVVTSILLKLNLYHPIRKMVLRLRNRGRAADQVFTDIYRENRWQGSESRSGEGSSLKQTQVIAEQLPEILAKYEVRSLFDIPCGDFFWMSKVKLDDWNYVGADIVSEVISENTARYGGEGRDFKVIDLCEGPLPKVDLVFCRDCLVHLPFELLARAVEQITASGSTFLMTTTFPATERNHDIALGDFRPLNLQLHPFNFPPPIELVVENCTESAGAHADKAMGVWRVSDLPQFGEAR